MTRTLTLHTKNENQYNIIVGLAREMGIKITVDDAEAAFLKRITGAAKEAKLIASGKKKAKTAEELLNEL